MAIRPKEGRYYKDGCGNVGGPAQRIAGGLHPWLVEFSGVFRAYADDGARFVGNEGHYTDLVSECDKDGNPIEDEAMTAAAQLVMKEGAYYEDGRGFVGGPAERMPSAGVGDCTWRVRFGFDVFTYMDNGRHSFSAHDVRNLVREVPDPTQAAPKPETVTITQEMVDRAILDAVKAGNPAWADEINHAWVGMQRVLTNAS